MKLSQLDTARKAVVSHPEQCIRLFFSADIAGASRFKYSTASKNSSTAEQTSWIEVIVKFFRTMTWSFRRHLAADNKNHSLPMYEFRLWKTLGDEIIFYQEISHKWQAFWMLRAFEAAIQEVHLAMVDDYRLGAKGTAWSAGFPIRNRQLILSAHSSIHAPIDSTDRIDDIDRVIPLRQMANSQVEFIGLEIDQGFRLSALGYPGRLVCSPDAAYLASDSYRQMVPRHPNTPIDNGEESVALNEVLFLLSIVGWKTLKGVLGDKPVPIVWLDFPSKKGREKREPRLIYEVAGSEFMSNYMDVTPHDPTAYMEFFHRYNNDLMSDGVNHILPYWNPIAVDRKHLRHFDDADRSTTAKGPLRIDETFGS